MYAVVGCSNEHVKVEGMGTDISKVTLGYIIITIDVITILCSVFYIMYLEHNIKANLKVNDLLTFETREFGLTF
jgi:hypothetical protein